VTGRPWPGLRPAWIEVDLEAIAANVRTLTAEVAPARLLAVVKADAYGHGAVPVAGAAVGSLARWLPAQAAKASTAAMAKAASPLIRGVCLVLRDPPVVASAPDLLSTVDLLPPRSLTVCLSLEPISSDA